jgi:hypothetical protein
MLEGQLNRFIMFDDETPHDTFNRPKKLVNKARALGSKKGTDCMLTKRFVDISYAALQVHGIVNVALHLECSPGIVFIFS